MNARRTRSAAGRAELIKQGEDGGKALEDVLGIRHEFFEAEHQQDKGKNSNKKIAQLAAQPEDDEHAGQR